MSDEKTTPVEEPATEPVAVQGQQEPVQVPQEEPVSGAAAVAEPAPEAPSRTSRRGLALGVAAALVAVLGGGGIGFAMLKHQQHDDGKTTAKPWKAPEPQKTGSYGVQSGGSHYGALGKLLLPMPAGYAPGPDMAPYGNDVELADKQAVSAMTEGYRDLPKKSRDAALKAVDRLRIQGIGMRSYATDDHEMLIEIRIVQMKNKQAARAGTEFFTDFTKALGVFRNGPSIAGHDKARCVLPPKKPGADLDFMECQATEGDLLVTMSVSGVAPLDKKAAAEVLAHQLDRIQDPGEAA
ncbi:hypothetical protein ACIP98_23885 [Streptomyces sp. NPDC088354]|uniref:hypothetical protein n=1 Tax=unclassified Streptomyces TaxID=2593676 RepID=UPI0029ABAE8B|nr:hypothetical protein [Streptomyces sp. MI02-7b]MDX3076491.1 hypothetical protein [Streptomyces sp. MI02-7b]